MCIFGLCCCASDYLSLMQFKIRCGGVAGRDGPDQMHVVCARGPSRDVYTWVCDSRIPPHTMYPFKFNLNLNLNLNLNYPFGTNIQLKLMM